MYNTGLERCTPLETPEKSLARVDLKTARAKMSELVEQAKAGTSTVITKYGKDWAVIGPLPTGGSRISRPEIWPEVRKNWAARNQAQAARDILLKGTNRGQ
jgi:prevent-host-death family protein